MPSGAVPRRSRSWTTSRPRWPEVAVTTMDMGWGSLRWGRGGSGSDEAEDEHRDGQHERRQRRGEVFVVAHPQVTPEGADEVGDDARRGQHAERLEPQA